MDMEAGIGTEELVGSCNNNDSTQVAKGKRTKRLRPLSPCAMTSSCSSVSGEHVSGGGDYGSFSSTATTFEGTGQEEEDMANCLILLAQGKGGGDDGATATATTSPITKIGLYIYECKTCNRTFPSFQALGGHRASHKKPKVTQEEKKPPPPTQAEPLQAPQPSQLLVANCEFVEAKQTHVKSSPPISLQFGCVSNRAFHVNKSKTHECSICGSEFTSGQALGGHMRRHRASTNTGTQVVGMNMMSGIQTSCDAATTAIAPTAVEDKPRNVLELDLNLPAPEDDVRDSKFQFTTTQKSMVLSAAPALVGCHY